MTRTKQWTYMSPSYLLYWIFSFYFINFNFFKSKPNFSFSSSPVVSLISTQNYYTIQQKNTKNTHSQKSKTHYFLLLKKNRAKKKFKSRNNCLQPVPFGKKAYRFIIFMIIMIPIYYNPNTSPHSMFAWSFFILSRSCHVTPWRWPSTRSSITACKIQP